MVLRGHATCILARNAQASQGDDSFGLPCVDADLIPVRVATVLHRSCHSFMLRPFWCNTAIQVFRVACHYGDSEAEVHETLRATSSSVFNKLLIFMLKEVMWLPHFHFIFCADMVWNGD